MTGDDDVVVDVVDDDELATTTPTDVDGVVEVPVGDTVVDGFTSVSPVEVLTDGTLEPGGTLTAIVALSLIHI